MIDRNAVIRLAGFDALDRMCQVEGEVLSRRSLEQGFEFEGQRIPMIAPPGIFWPAALSDAPLSINTSPPHPTKPRPYDDEFGEDGILRYRYRGVDPNHRDNRGLRNAMIERLPLVYFCGLVPGRYLPVWPVFIVGDEPDHLTFHVKADDAMALDFQARGPALEVADLRRTYVTVQVQRRMHQQAFRMRVLQAYLNQCSICKLRHLELLDAAHILEDRHPKGLPSISNGLAMCKLHHAAFDRSILGIRPDLRIEVRFDILKEIDGPMLVHGIQEFHEKLISVPKQTNLRPNADHLEERYARFRQAG